MSHDDQIGAQKARPEGEAGHKTGEGGPLDPGVQPAQHLTPGMLDPDDLLDALREDTGGSGAGTAGHGSGAITIKAQPGAGTIKAKPGVTAPKPKPGAGHSAPKPPHGTSKPPRQGGSGGGGRSKVPGS
jgi:hypothetical protein